MPPILLMRQREPAVTLAAAVPYSILPQMLQHRYPVNLSQQKRSHTRRA
jgi:hypothetical protein